jgi:GntR family transcriptional regulator
MAKRPRLEPLRYQIRDFILDLLRRDKYKPGDKIPTESELLEMMRVSRASLREGLHLLEEERVIRTRHGAGRYVLSAPSDLEFDIARLQSVTEMLEGYDMPNSIQVLSATVQPASPEIALSLEIEEGTPVVCIERTRSVGDIPVIYSIDIIDERHFAGQWSLDDFAGSLLNYLQEQCDIVLDYSLATIKAVPGSVLPNSTIQIEQEVPWILFIQTNYDQLGEPIIFSKDYHRSDYISFHVRRLRF